MALAPVGVASYSFLASSSFLCQAATKASVEQRKQKLEALAADLQALQAKMTAVEAMSAEKAGPVTQLAASHAHIPGVKPKAKGASAKGKQAAGKAAAAHAHDVESHDVAARDPRPLPGMNHADQHSRGSATGAVQAGYWSRS
jgi:peptidoglycan hydrolase CwlO-like protein